MKYPYLRSHRFSLQLLLNLDSTEIVIHSITDLSVLLSAWPFLWVVLNSDKRLDWGISSWPSETRFQISWCRPASRMTARMDIVELRLNEFLQLINWGDLPLNHRLHFSMCKFLTFWRRFVGVWSLRIKLSFLLGRQKTACRIDKLSYHVEERFLLIYNRFL